MSRETNVEIFEDTQKFYSHNPKLKSSIDTTIKYTQIISETDNILCENTNVFNTEIVITKDRTFKAGQQLLKEGYNSVCVHNFASATNPGGGVVKGSSAQEECLCRCSTLYPTLNTKECMQKFYYPHRKQNAIHNGDCIYTPNITVFKSDVTYPELMAESDWYNVNVITCAAPNLRDNPNNKWNTDENATKVTLTQKELYEIHKFRLQRIIDIAYANNNECLVIGAFGCGAFRNEPSIVARAMKDTLAQNKGKFKKIVLAIYCSPKDTTNYEVFKRIFGL